ncbi:MAG: ABC transporter ATP-binding protein/permease [Prevotella sp.]|uniref:ABC transporter ATP-binding protein n=1 Tax=Hallella sp. TaxID=2980186 RepID=UPI00258F1BEC|nr:ABC transporter ATP-binding protein [Hallella sp.]MCI6806325.1 ABC transporter ATP-binding protein/permease [Prevotella sp.]MCI7434252.1 ABC transporter ATP-binding protein/permease [Prevotella sp.]MDD7145867.1 ABC transporter ATP-binding protein [Hallella sp.]MDY5033278.1 ABC transporter ATP-binding protein [Prevotella sp.]
MLKQFLSIMSRYLSPYRAYLAWAIVLNFFSQWMNVFSFVVLIPILNILFKIDHTVYHYRPWTVETLDKDLIVNNGYAYVQELIANHGAFLTLVLMGVVLIVMTAIKTAGTFASSAVMVPLRTGIVRDIRTELYNKVLRLPLSFFSEERKGDIIARMSADVQGVENSITSSIDMLIRQPIAILVCFATMLSVSWQLTLFVIFVTPVAGWGMGKVSRRLKSQSVAVQSQWGDIIAQLDETLGGLRIIKAFIAETKMGRRFRSINDNYRRGMSSMVIRQNAAHPMSEFLGTVVIVIVLWFGGWLILNGTNMIDASTFIFYMVILYSVINPLKELSKATYQIPLGLASMDRIDFILKADNPIKDPATPIRLKDFETEVTLDDVSFHYVEGRDVVKHVSLRVPKGKTIALVGQSGSGKSTLVDLIPRYHDVSSGKILINGHDIRDYAIHDLRGLIGNVNQEAILFNDTFYNNITFGVEDATMEQVIEAAKIANAHEFIMESPDGYNTMIGDRGGRLSGGQRQRISIARAILKNPPILILDEATSALDTESERLVQEALERLMKSRTTIAIAHRLSTIKNADEIFVMYEGEIVEHGQHHELIARNGYYKRLYDMQQL